MLGESGEAGEARGPEGPEGSRDVAEPNAVRLNDRGELEFFDGQQWMPYTDVAEDDPGPLSVVFRRDQP
jgi:hypothetical protein